MHRSIPGTPSTTLSPISQRGKNIFGGGFPRDIRVDVLHGLVVGGRRPLPAAAEGRAQEGEEPRRGAEGARGRREAGPTAPEK